MSPCSVRAAPAPSPRAGARADRDGGAPRNEDGAEFERLLRCKSAAFDERREEQSLPTAAGEAGPGGIALPAPPLRAAAAGAPTGPVGTSAELDLPKARAAIETALNTPAPPAQLPGAPSDAAGSWNLSLAQPLGEPLQLRATRTLGSAEAQPGWALTIASPAHDAGLLVQQAPRLNERLRARALSAHVRIESQDERPT